MPIRPIPSLLMLACSILLACTAATAATLTVCLDGSCQFTTIQAAVDAANPGDVIEVSAETYLLEEPIEPFGKAITIRGSVDPITGLPATILDAQSITRAPTV